jgi:hypothetical protein
MNEPQMAEAHKTPEDSASSPSLKLSNLKYISDEDGFDSTNS